MTRSEEIELAAKRIRILNARGDSKKAESEFKKLKESKKKDNWTIESWKERFDEDVDQSEIDEINQSNKVFNDLLDNAVKSFEQNAPTPAPAKPKAEPAKTADISFQLKEGDKVGVRLNLNIRKTTGENVLSVHDKSFGGKVLGNSKAITLKNVKFNVNKNAAEKIASGESTKFPMASVDGEFTKSKNSTEGVEIFFDPKKSNEFVDKDGYAVESAQEVSVIGNKTYARGVKYKDNKNFGYHGGNLQEKSDYLTSGYRGDMPFTGYYFHSTRDKAEARGNRSQLPNSDLSVVDFSKYNLLKPTTNEYWSIKSGLKKFEDRFLRGNIDEAFESLENRYGLKDLVPSLYEQIQ
jgi:hypothetical protein